MEDFDGELVFRRGEAEIYVPFFPLRRKECEVTIEHDIIPLFTASTKYMTRD